MTKGIPYFSNPEYCPVISLKKWIDKSQIIKFNYHRLFLHYGYFDLWLIMYNQTMIIVPYLLMGPGLFTGAMTLGVLIQTSSAFREVQSSFSLFLQNWTRITELRSIYKRLMEFETAINFKNKLRKPRKSDVRA